MHVLLDDDHALIAGMTVKFLSDITRLLREWYCRRIEELLAGLVGGPEWLRVIILLVSVLSLDSADKATVGARLPVRRNWRWT